MVLNPPPLTDHQPFPTAHTPPPTAHPPPPTTHPPPPTALPPPPTAHLPPLLTLSRRRYQGRLEFPQLHFQGNIIYFLNKKILS